MDYRIKGAERRKFLLVLNIICPILIGAILYYFTSPDVLFVKKIDSLIGSDMGFHIRPADHIFFRLIRNYLPDMLWGYALTFALIYIIGNNTAPLWKVFLAAFSFSAAMELLQMTPIAPGTFDIFDIAAEGLSETVAVFIIKRLLNGGNEK